MSDGQAGHVWLVGAGPGDPGLITVAGLAALRQADVVLYDRLAPHDLLAEAPPHALLVDAGKAADNHAMTQEQINAALVDHGLAGRRVVRLKGGDPYVFGRGGEEAMALAAAGVPCTVIPGVTSAIGGLAAGGIPVTHRAVATSFAVITGHEDPTKPEAQVDWERLATAVDTLVILMGVGRIDEIARALVEGGRDASTPAALVQQATTPDQRTVTATLGTIAAAAARQGVRPPALFVVGPVAALQAELDPRRLAPLAGARVLVTRSRTQASTLIEALRLEGAHPLVLPAIEIEQRVDAAQIDRAVAALRERAYAWVVFTSTNAVEVFFDALQEAGADARAFAGGRICALGIATAAALADRGLIADLVPTEAVGESLVQALVAAGGLAGARVLLPRAEGARDVIPDGLRAAGAGVDEVTLYLAAPPAHAPTEVLAAVREGRVDAVTFTSSSTVRNLATLLGGDLSALHGAKVVCIGPVTAQTAREYGLEPDAVAEPHTVEALLTALRECLHSARTGAAKEVR